MTSSGAHFDAFLSHSHEDTSWIEGLARRLEDECGFTIWLDRWVLGPGKLAAGHGEGPTGGVQLRGMHRRKDA